MRFSRSPLLPCATCPWRVDQTAASIPRYNHTKACNLSKTCGEDDDFRNIMACHASTESDPYACCGYLAREGERNLTVRMLVARGMLPSWRDVQAACEEARIKLHTNYRAVLRKLARTKK